MYLLDTPFQIPKPLTAGIPQCSVLGPLLFLVYVNDIADALISTTILFADDSTLAASDSEVMGNVLNSDLELIW